MNCYYHNPQADPDTACRRVLSVDRSIWCVLCTVAPSVFRPFSFVSYHPF
jgi:hypothetical protein